MTWVVIASGASLTPEDVNHCRDKAKVCVVNNNHELAPWADMLYAADLDWWDARNPEDFKGEKWTCNPDAAKKYGLNHINGENLPKVSTNPHLIHYGGNSGFQAINLVYHRAPERILLLGFDMQDTDGKKHWFGDHPWPLRNTNVWSKHIRCMEEAATEYKKLGVEVINCSRQTALKGFARGIITEVLC
jgi:hypothetical protein